MALGFYGTANKTTRTAGQLGSQGHGAGFTGCVAGSLLGLELDVVVVEPNRPWHRRAIERDAGEKAANLGFEVLLGRQVISRDRLGQHGLRLRVDLRKDG
jgi:hypothetical protein